MEGLKLAQEKGILGFSTYLYSTLGEIELEAGNLEDAEKYFSQGLTLSEEFGVKERIAGLTANLGLLSLRRGETNLAIHQLSSALSLSDALGTKHLSSQIRIWLAPLLPRTEALYNLAEARAFAETSGRKRLLDEILAVEKIVR
jgi:tetratricopeptide (TPR) repeat protein